MKRQIWIPLCVGFCLVGLVVTMALTDLFQPLISFIHSQNITLLQAVGCFFGAIIAFYLVYKVLVKLGEYFLP